VIDASYILSPVNSLLRRQRRAAWPLQPLICPQTTRNTRKIFCVFCVICGHNAPPQITAHTERKTEAPPIDDVNNRALKGKPKASSAVASSAWFVNPNLIAQVFLRFGPAAGTCLSQKLPNRSTKNQHKEFHRRQQRQQRHASVLSASSCKNHFTSSHTPVMPNAKLTDDEERAKCVRIGTCG
jgi:hypothetical protein